MIDVRILRIITFCTVLLIACVTSGQSWMSVDSVGVNKDHMFYVSTEGSDSGPGSLTRPWRTIQHAADALSPGDTLNVRGGVYNESVNIRVSGSGKGGFVTLRSYPGERAILDGAGLGFPDGREHGLLNVQDQSYLSIAGFEIRNYVSKDRHDIPAGISISGYGSDINILDNHIHDIDTYATGTLCSKKGTGSANAFGIVVYGTSASVPLSRLVVGGNEVDHLRTGCSESIVVNGNVQDWMISKNAIHDNDNIAIDAIGFEHVSPSAKYDRARDGTIADNVIDNISSDTNSSYAKGDLSADGIYVDGGAFITIERNRVRNVDIGIEIASEARGKNSSNIIVRNNLISRSHSAGISIGGYDATVGGTADCVIADNTLVDDDTRMTGSGEFQVQYGAVKNIFKNNVVVAGAQGVVVNSYLRSTTSTVLMDANLYSSIGGINATRWRWNGVEYRDLRSYQVGGGQEAHSVVREPDLLLKEQNDALRAERKLP